MRMQTLTYTCRLNYFLKFFQPSGLNLSQGYVTLNIKN